MAEVAYVRASRIYPGTPEVRAVDRLELEVADGEFLVLVGPSGSGKSTALRMVAGLENVDECAVHIGRSDVTHTPPKARATSPWSPSPTRCTRTEIQAKVTEAAAMLDLTKYLERKPKALSGGQRQRVAMGRKIVRSPRSS